MPSPRLRDRARVARLYRRLGWGAAAGELPALCQKGASGALKALTRPDAVGLPPAPVDPWAGLDLVADMEGEKRGEMATAAVHALLTLFVTSPRPLQERMAWFWHGHLVSSLREVNQPELLARQFRLFREEGQRRFPDLLRRTITDAAMLEYLDGKSSTKRSPNENLSRELKELFALGIGNYTEDDVKAGARALTGWVIGPPPALAAEFRAERHDPTPQTYLGRPGVHDVDTVVAAIGSHPAMPGFVAGKLTRELLGPNATARDVDKAARVFRTNGLAVDRLVSHLATQLARGVDRGPVVLSPTRWFVMAVRATGSTYELARARGELDNAGQLPFFPPHVGGWPSGPAWFSTAATVSRLNLAARLTEQTPENGPVAAAAVGADWDALSVALGLPEPFTAGTRNLLGGLTTWRDRLALALCCPEFVLA